MSPREERVIEEINDFSAVNNHIDQLLNRQRDLLAYRKFKLIKSILVGLSILIVGIGLAYLLYSWGLKLQREEAVPVLSDIPIPEKIEHEDRTAKTVTVSFTVFQTADVSEDTSVVTGYNYSPENLDTPTDQYCYVAIVSGPAKKDTYYVARKYANNMVEWDTNVPSNLFDLGQAHCLFKN